jgi:hypothetical protein
VLYKTTLIKIAMKKLIALLIIASFAGSAIAQNAPQQKTEPNAVSKDKEKHHHHRHHHEHRDEKK